MTYPVMLFVFLCAALVQNLVPGWAILGGAQVPLIMSVVMYYALTRGLGSALFAAVVGGVIQDASGQVPVGYSATCFCVIVLLLTHYKAMLDGESPVTAAVVGGLGGSAVGLVLSMLLWRDHVIEATSFWIVMKVGGSGILGLICTPLVFPVILWLDRLVGNVAPRKESLGEFKLP